MSADQLDIYRRCTGLSAPPTASAIEAWLIVGRRGGKSFVLALIAVFLATFRDWQPHLALGERGTVMVLAADRRQARVIMRYIKGLLQNVPMLARLLERETGESVDLNNRITIEVHTASFRTVRGYTVIAALLDEIAFWRTEDSANPDSEILTAIRPAMSTVPGAMLLCASSPYARRGALYGAWREHHGKDSDVLVWQGDTRTMNPTVPQKVIDDAYLRDPASAAAEYGAEFRSDVEGFVSPEAVDACIVPGRYELPALRDVRYFGAVDAAGGSGADSMTMAVAHKDGERVVIDAVREHRPPFSPEAVVADFVVELGRYGIKSAVADRWGSEFVRERFERLGVHLEQSAKPKSELYGELLPVINSGKIELLDNTRLIAQLVGLERRTSRSGKDSIDHAPGSGPGSHDDLINSVAIAVSLVQRPQARPSIRFLGDPQPGYPRPSGLSTEHWIRGWNG